MLGSFNANPKTESRQAVRRLREWPAGTVPALVAAVMCLPGFSFPYLHDDFEFLARAQHFTLSQLLPDATVMYWRPLSREIYFGILCQFGGIGPFLGHSLNLVLFAAATFLLTDVVERLGGRAAAILSGLVFAVYAQTPFLVAWVSGCQDLLAMTLVLASLRWRLLGRGALAAGAFVLALLSKETSVAAMPVLASLDWLLGSRPSRVLRGWSTYGALALAWAFLHPGIRHLVMGGLAPAPAGAVGIHDSIFAAAFLRGMATVLNLPLHEVNPLALRASAYPVGMAALLAALAFYLLDFRDSAPPAGAARFPSSRRLVWLAALLCALPLALTSLLVPLPSPYYACIPFIGAAIVMGLVLSRVPTRTALSAVIVFVGLGGISLASRTSPELPTMWNMEPAARAVQLVESRFKALEPRLSEPATLYVSVQSSGPTGIYAHIHRFQALRIWYRNPRLLTLTPEDGRPFEGNARLFWVSPTYDVSEIDLATLRPRSTGAVVRLGEYEKVLRRYAVGRASAGDLGQAVTILTRIDTGGDLTLRAYDWRLAGALLLSSGREDYARRLLEGVPAFKREPALDMIMTTIGEYLGKTDHDDSVMRAFGISPTDSLANRSLMLGLDLYGWRVPAARFARRVLVRNPQDAQARRILASGEATRGVLPITIPVAR